MKKLITTLFSLVMIGASLSASESLDAIREIRHIAGSDTGVAVEMADQVEMDGESWKMLKKESEGVTFQIQLPDQRVFTSVNNGWGATVTEKDGAYYEVATAVPAIKNINEYTVMFELGKQYSAYPYQLQNKSVRDENGDKVIEISAYNVETNEIVRIKAIDSGNNLHVATVKFPADQDTSRDDIFLTSFAVLD